MERACEPREGGRFRWAVSGDELDDIQRHVARSNQGSWKPANPVEITMGGCFVCFGKGHGGAGSKGDRGWAGAALVRDGLLLETAAVRGEAGSHYVPGKLALREGRLLQAAVEAAGTPPDVLLVNATGLDHPRRAGLAVHLGAVLGIPTVGVTWRPLLAEGVWPGPGRGQTSPLRLYGEVVAAWLRTRAGAHPVVVHPGWMTDLETALDLVLSASLESATPEPIRQARRIAREARAGRRRTVQVPGDRAKGVRT